LQGRPPGCHERLAGELVEIASAEKEAKARQIAAGQIYHRGKDRSARGR
jgi:hypothetical protein